MAMDVDTALHELVLTRPVTENDIVQAHRRMAMRFHPDKAADPDEKRWAQQKFVQVQEAYELLKGLPIETINASPDRKVSQETSGGSRQQPKGCSAQQPRHEEPHPSQKLADSIVRWADKVGFLCRVVAVGLILSPVLLFPFWLLGSRPQCTSGSPTAQTTAAPETVALVRAVTIQMDADAEELQQTFGRLLTIRPDPHGGYLAHFERIKTVYDGQVIHGFEVGVLPNEVTFTKNGFEWPYSQLVNYLSSIPQHRQGKAP